MCSAIAKYFIDPTYQTTPLYYIDYTTKILCTIENFVCHSCQRDVSQLVEAVCMTRLRMYESALVSVWQL